jgi:hypothetical protein
LRLRFSSHIRSNSAGIITIKSWAELKLKDPDISSRKFIALPKNPQG